MILLRQAIASRGVAGCTYQDNQSEESAVTGVHSKGRAHGSPPGRPQRRGNAWGEITVYPTLSQSAPVHSGAPRSFCCTWQRRNLRTSLCSCFLVLFSGVLCFFVSLGVVLVFVLLLFFSSLFVGVVLRQPRVHLRSRALGLARCAYLAIVLVVWPKG